MRRPLSQTETFGNNALTFYKGLAIPVGLPKGIEVINPYKAAEASRLCKAFCDRFYNDTREKTFVFGINPGRFGGGTTGVNFTDPYALEEFCGIKNNLPKVRERSSEFIYSVIQEWGGARKFYRDFFLTALCPLGFTKRGVNYNYYDDPKVCRSIEPFIISTLIQQLDLGANREAVIILGTGKNYKFFVKINEKFGFFKTVYPLEHPRFIMQYRRKDIETYMEKYRKIFKIARP